MVKKALIFGISGQDGSWLAELLLGKGYEVHGVVRRTSQNTLGCSEHLRDKLIIHTGDVTDMISVASIIRIVQPDEIYNLAAQSHVTVSFECPVSTLDITGMGVVRILEAIRIECPTAKFFQASSSEMFGSAKPPQNEETKFQPQSPYAIAKVLGYYAVKLYRDAYGLFACNGIMYNHESERRSDNFVTRKVTKAVARIALNKQKVLELGNINTRRDWSYAPEVMEAAWKIMQLKKPCDLIIATGEAHTVKEFVKEAFNVLGLDWKKYVKINKGLQRPLDVRYLKGDFKKAQKLIGWAPKVRFKELVRLMVLYDYVNEV